jgi:hypothetical protein
MKFAGWYGAVVGVLMFGILCIIALVSMARVLRAQRA